MSGLLKRSRLSPLVDSRGRPDEIFMLLRKADCTFEWTIEENEQAGIGTELTAVGSHAERQLQRRV